MLLSTAPPKRYAKFHNLHYRPTNTSVVYLSLVTIIFSLFASLTTALSPTPSPQNPTIRGDRYGSANGSSIPTPSSVARILNVKPTKSDATALQWKRAWNRHKRILPLLHSFDSCRPPDSSLNLACLWWKALAGNDKDSPVYDDGLSYDLLPRGFRWLVGRRTTRFYPRLHHANVEMRTAFLDGAVDGIVSSLSPQTKVRLVSLGAGYDVRSVKFLERGSIDRAVEIDLPRVVEAKRKLLGPRRLLRRRPRLADLNMPLLLAADFNDVESVKIILRDVLAMTSRGVDNEGSNEGSLWHTIFVFEGVMIYLNEGVPSSLLEATSSVLKECGLSGSLCFADRLENVPGGDFDLGKEELKRNGWILKSWLPKPGLARHMGSANL